MNLTEETIKNYMLGVREHLTKEYKQINPEWEITLGILEDQLILYKRLKDTINEQGLMNGAGTSKNPLLSTQKDCVATILKLSQKLGISPWDYSKIHNDGEEDTESFIDSLTGEND